MLERANAAADTALPTEKQRWLYSLGGVVTAVSVYGALHITARLLASANLGEDDPLDAVFTQTLQPGYVPRQPPLYDWLLWLVEQVTGPGALPFQLIKYALLTATCAFIFASARRAMKGDAFWAFLSVEALALIYQISWRFHEGFTHAVGAMCAVAAALWAMLRLIEPRRGDGFDRAGADGSPHWRDDASHRAGDDALRRAGDYALHRAGDDASHRAGEEALHRGRDDASHRAGDDALRRAGEEVLHRGRDDAPHRAGDDALRRAGDYALFGLVAGLGLLTVTPFWVYLGALIGAAALQPASRRVVIHPAFLASIAIALAVASPYLLWLAGTPEGLAAIVPQVKIGGSHYWRTVFGGLQRAFTEPVMYLAPLIFLYPLFFPNYLATLRRNFQLAAATGPRVDAEQLILHLTLLNVGALVLGALFFGVERYPTHALMPLFLVTSIWLTAQARKAARNTGEIRRFVIMAVSVAVFAFAARCANMYVQEPVCQICRWGIPYAGLAEAIRGRGFERGDLVVYHDDLAGNLRRFFPEARIVIAGPRNYAPPERAGETGRQTVLLWDASEPAEAVTRGFNGIFPERAAQLMAKADALDIPWRHHLWKPDGYRMSHWRMSILGQR